MPAWNGYSAKWYNFLEAHEMVQAEIVDEGITFDFERMDYVDTDGNTVPSEQVGQRRNELMAERGYNLDEPF